MDAPCPKIEELQKDVDSLKDAMRSVQYTLYVICGVVIAEFGVTIFRG